MTRRWLTLTVLLMLAGRAAANIRPPLKVDGFFSGGLRSLPVSGAVRLVREDLRIAFPDFRTGMSGAGPAVAITVRYEIVNSQAGEIDMRVHFLAVDIRTITASMDGQALAVELTQAPAEKSECLWRLTRHRASFQSGFYREFLGRMRRAAGLMESPDGQWLDDLKGKDLSGIGPEQIYPIGRSRPEAGSFMAGGISLRLKPGLNRLEIAYAQRMFIDERGYGYSSGWPKKGFSGADYLLYPGTSWPKDPGFRLSVSVEIPEISERKLFGTTWLRPGFESNLPFLEAGSERPHVRIRRAEFSDFPADILSILIWFDPKAARFFSD
jgi:hypothetical protein